MILDNSENQSRCDRENIAPKVRGGAGSTIPFGSVAGLLMARSMKTCALPTRVEFT